MTLQERFKLNRSEKKTDQKKITYIPIENIRPNPYQPRRNFEHGALEELCKSIKEYGVIQPINVRKTKTNHFELVSGERRLRASILAGLKEIPAIVIDVNENDLAIMALIENLQREDLGYMEEAEGYSNLIKDHGLTQEELAQKIGKSQSTIANKIRLLKLPPMVKKMLSDHQLTERHARALLKLHDEQLQLRVLKKVCEKGLNVKKTEELVQKAKENNKKRNDNSADKQDEKNENNVGNDERDKPGKGKDSNNKPEKGNANNDKPGKGNDNNNKPGKENDNIDKPDNRNDKSKNQGKGNDNSEKPGKGNDNFNESGKENDNSVKPGKGNDKKVNPNKENKNNDKSDKGKDKEVNPGKESDNSDKPGKGKEKNNKQGNENNNSDKPDKGNDKTVNPNKGNNNSNKPGKGNDKKVIIRSVQSEQQQRQTR
jgi:ParB family chromosome partitioning protein